MNQVTIIVEELVEQSNKLLERVNELKKLYDEQYTPNKKTSTIPLVKKQYTKNLKESAWYMIPEDIINDRDKVGEYIQKHPESKVEEMNQNSIYEEIIEEEEVSSEEEEEVPPKESPYFKRKRVQDIKTPFKKFKLY